VILDVQRINLFENADGALSQNTVATKQTTDACLKAFATAFVSLPVFLLKRTLICPLDGQA